MPIDILEPRAPRDTAPPQRRSLLLHCGAREISRQDVFGVPTPRPTSSWFPIPHRTLIEEVEHHLDGGGFEVTRQTYALSHEGARFFGVFELRGRSADRDYSWVVGLRNSHDKVFPAGLAAGTVVTVCDNLCFSGEVKISRKHTRFALRDLRMMTSRAVGRLGSLFQHADERITRYKALALRDQEAHDLVVRAVDCRAITTTDIPDVLTHWRTPPHEEFLPRTGWSLFNAFTEVHKNVNPHTALQRGEALHGLFDQRVGLPLVQLN
jgi:hypothetical protein